MTLPRTPDEAPHPGTVFFDIDGTLLLTREGRDAMSQAFRRQFSVPEAFSDVDFAGATDPDVVNQICEKHELRPSDAQHESFFSDYYQRLACRLDGSINILPGSHEILRVLRYRPVNLGLITGNNPGGARVKLQSGGFLDYFSGGAYGDDGPERQRIVEAGLDRFETDPSRSVIIGDSIHDVRTGKAHGLHTIAVSTGTTDHSTLESENPDLLLTSLAPPASLLSYLDEHDIT